MQGVAENDTVNLEGLLSHGAICHRKSLYCLLMYSVHILLHPAFLCHCLCACVHLLMCECSNVELLIWSN